MIKILKEQNIRCSLTGKLILYADDTPGFRELGRSVLRGPNGSSKEQI